MPACFGAAPIFLSLTKEFDSIRRNQLVLRVAMNSFLLLLGSMLCGSYVLEFFGVTISAVRVAGGAIVAYMGWTLLNGRDGPSAESSSEKKLSRAGHDGFYPLTLSLTVGPGSISVALTIGAHHASQPFTAQGALVLGGALLGLLALAATIYVAYRFASPLVRCLGQTGVDALVRLSAFILVCIGAQIGWGGLTELIASLHGSSLPGLQDTARLTW
jgi:multiple antibiotic resistance protein